MSEQEPDRKEEDASKLPDGGKSEDADLEDLFKEEEAPEGETAEEKVARLEAEMATVKKGVAKYFSEKGQKERAARDKKEDPKEPTNHASDDVTELFLESRPEAALVKEDLQKIADKLYDGSIIKAWKSEEWLQVKAKALSETAANKEKINAPDSQTSSAMPMDVIAKLPDEELAAAIRKMSDKDYQKWKDYQKRQASAYNGGMISLSPR